MAAETRYGTLNIKHCVDAETHLTQNTRDLMKGLRDGNKMFLAPESGVIFFWTRRCAKSCRMSLFAHTARSIKFRTVYRNDGAGKGMSRNVDFRRGIHDALSTFGSPICNVHQMSLSGSLTMVKENVAKWVFPFRFSLKSILRGT